MTDHDLSPEGLLAYAGAVLQQESEAIGSLKDSLGQPFLDAVRTVQECKGLVVVTGMGKAGQIGSKLSATLASTGTRSMFLHPAEAVHGDLGRIYHEDLVLALSMSGTTEEVVRLLQPVKRLGSKLIAITTSATSPLGEHADVCLEIGPVVEACPLGLAPTTSTSVMLALGDALALTVMLLKNFSPDEFAAFHPAGSLGRGLLTVAEVMRTGRFSPTTTAGSPLGRALQAMTETRAGAVTIVDATGKVVGFFTDGDLRRTLMGHSPLDIQNLTVDEVMTKNPKSIGPGHLASEAVHLMKKRELDQIVVVDEAHHPLGLLDVQDLMKAGLV